MDVLAKLDQTRGAINVLEHPFYQRWSAGDLSAEELALYAGEYRRAVLALARASTLAADQAGPEIEVDRFLLVCDDAIVDQGKPESYASFG